MNWGQSKPTTLFFVVGGFLSILNTVNSQNSQKWTDLNTKLNTASTQIGGTCEESAAQTVAKYLLHYLHLNTTTTGIGFQELIQPSADFFSKQLLAISSTRDCRN